MSAAKIIYRIISWSLLVLTLLSILLVLRKPSVPTVETSPEAAKSFDHKLSQLVEAPKPEALREIRITEMELNSKLQESLQNAPASGGPASLSGAAVSLEGDHLVGTFTINVGGKDVYVTLGGKLAVSNGSLEFNPTSVKMGSMPVPVGLVESALRGRLNSSGMAAGPMKLPESITDVRIENGELVLGSR